MDEFHTLSQERRFRELRAWLQLVRLPTVFTAMADVFLGFLAARQSFSPPEDFALLLAASSCLYLAGMLFNDVFDRKEDARLRPERPIPSGRVSLKSAVIAGCVLMAGGIIAAARVGSGNSLVTAVALGACIFAYDGGAKRTYWGPFVMGGCRFLNVLLGASVVSPFPELAAYMAAGLAVYVAGVTAFAKHEAERSRPSKLASAALLVNAGIAILLAIVLIKGGGAGFRQAVLLAVIAGSIDLRLFAAIRDPSPERVQTAVRTMLLSLVMIDAALVWFAVKSDAAPLYAMLTAALVVPSLVLGRFLKMT